MIIVSFSINEERFEELISFSYALPFCRQITFFFLLLLAKPAVSLMYYFSKSLPVEVIVVYSESGCLFLFNNKLPPRYLATPRFDCVCFGLQGQEEENRMQRTTQGHSRREGDADHCE